MQRATMPSKSPFPDVEIPSVDLWALIFDRKNRPFSDDKVIYRAVNASRSYTFADVKAHATAFGEGLCNLWDWQRGDVLALYTPNDIDVPPVIYGTFFAGGIVTPANPGYSADELAYQLENAGAKALVTTKAFLATALEAARKAGIAEDRVILLGEEKDASHRVKHWSNIRKTSGALRYRRRKADPEDLAFLAYSSGTTGLPKGVMLSHRNIVADLLQIEGAVGKWYSHTTDKFLGVLPFFHIYGLTGLVHQMLHRGIELVVMPAFDMEVFLRAIQEHRITFIYVAPPVIVRLARDKLVDKYDLSSVKMITSGAAPLTKELVDAVHKRLGIKINQAYGLSETSPMTHTQVRSLFLTRKYHIIPLTCPTSPGTNGTAQSVAWARCSPTCTPNTSPATGPPSSAPAKQASCGSRGPTCSKGTGRTPLQPQTPSPRTDSSKPATSGFRTNCTTSTSPTASRSLSSTRGIKSRRRSWRASCWTTRVWRMLR